MPSLDDVAAFARAYVQAEHEAAVAALREGDRARYERALQKAMGDHAYDRAGDWHWSSLPFVWEAADDPAPDGQRAEELAPRTLLILKQHRHADGERFAAYLTPPSASLRYGQLLYVAEVDGRLRIVAAYEACQRDGVAHWRWTSGAEVRAPGQVVGVRAFASPDASAVDRRDFGEGCPTRLWTDEPATAAERPSLDAFIEACYAEDADVIHDFVAAAAPEELDAPNAQGYTALLAAIDGRNPEVALYLLDRGVSAAPKLPGNYTALHLLITKIRNRPLNLSVTVAREGGTVTYTEPDDVRRVMGGHPDDEYGQWLALAERLVEAGVEVEAAKDGSGQRALRDAAETSPELVEMLLERADPDVNAVDHEGFTPLHMAARAGDTRTLRLLLDAGARVDAAENHGFTPLHEAILARKRAAAALLLEAGADPSRALVRACEGFAAGDDARVIAASRGLGDLFPT